MKSAFATATRILGGDRVGDQARRRAPHELEGVEQVAVGVRAEVGALEVRVSGGGVTADGGGAARGLGEHRVGPVEDAAGPERVAEIDEESEALLVVGRQEPGRPLEQVRRGRDVAALVGATAGAGEEPARALAERPAGVVEGAELVVEA